MLHFNERGIASIKGNERTQTLLDEARRISDKVRAQEETMRYEVQQLQASRHQLNIQNFQLQTRFQDFDKSLSIMELDPKGSVIRANEFMLDALGYEEEAVFNENFAKFVSERAFQSTAFQHLWQNVLEGIGQNQQMTFYTFNSTPLSFWVHFVPLRNEKDVVNHIVAICTDITSVQTSLERAQSRWSAIRQIFYYVEFTPFGIIQEANQPYLKLVGRTLGQIRNLPHSVLSCLPTAPNRLIIRSFGTSFRKARRRLRIITTSRQRATIYFCLAYITLFSIRNALSRAWFS